jgi:L-arabinokinase
VRSAVSSDLLARTIRRPYDLRPGATDSGIVQSTSIAHDDHATLRAALDFYGDFDRRVDAEAAALARDRVSLVVADIPPLAFEVAHRLDVPSIAIANFTWDWIYQTHPGLVEAAPWLVPRIQQAYGHATQALRLPFSGDFDVFPHVTPIPLIARHATRTRAETRAHFQLPIDRPMALLSFGGYGLASLDLDKIDCLDRWTVVTTDRSTAGDAPPPAHVARIAERAFIDSGFRYEDLVRAADVVITKPGYGIIAECIAAETAMLYTSRGHFREYDVLVREMPRYLRCAFIEQDDLLAGRWRAGLDALITQPAAVAHLGTDGAQVAAATIAERLQA